MNQDWEKDLMEAGEYLRVLIILYRLKVCVALQFCHLHMTAAKYVHT